MEIKSAWEAARSSGKTAREAGARVAAACLAALSIISMAGGAWATPEFEPLTDADFRQPSMEKVELGRLLFYDKVLSGNRNIACGDCHNHDNASSDRVSLAAGEGGSGLGLQRTARSPNGDRVKRRMPRNTPALFNLGAHEFTVLMADGRIQLAPGRRSNFYTPADDYTPVGLDSVLAAQVLFPPITNFEMAGQPLENEIADATDHPTEGWKAVENRLRETAAYLPLFQKAYPQIDDMQDVTIVHYANAMAAFIGFEFRADNSPFDRYLRGEEGAMTAEARRGMDLFYGKAGCGGCHSGRFQTDHDFHSIAMPQIGPGEQLYFDDVASDMGMMDDTHDPMDAYKFRTPSLRNVTSSAPYGHSGAFATLEAVVRHHLDPVASFNSYDPSQVVLPKGDAVLARLDFAALRDDRDRAAILKANQLRPVALSDEEVDAILAFLEALTDEDSLDGRLGKPTAVPSGLPVH